jgi:hypothetical protein
MFIAAVLDVLAGIRRIDFQPVIERHALSVATYARRAAVRAAHALQIRDQR